MIFGLPSLIYLVILAVVIFIEAATIGRWWRKKENVRWAIGYVTVFGLGLPLVWLDVWDAKTWLGLFLGVSFSGVIKVVYHQYKDKYG